MRNKLLIFILFSFFCRISKSQVTKQGNRLDPQIIASSPNAASLGTFGLQSINLFTGKPDININLFNLSESKYTLPLNLTYNTSLIKPQEHPGWIGLGWSLITGGAVNRRVNGGVDEVLVSIVNPETKLSYYTNYSILNRSDWNNFNFMDSLMEGMKQLGAHGPYSPTANPSPDEFSFSANGISGSFYKNHAGNWVVRSSSNIDFKIEDSLFTNFQLTDSLYTTESHRKRIIQIKRIIYGFKITDDKGIQYIFGMNPESIEFSANPDSAVTVNNENYIANTWYLTKIISPTNDSLKFSYINNQHPIFEAYPSITAGSYKMNGNGNTYLVTSTNITRNYHSYLSTISSKNTIIQFYKSHSNDLDYNIHAIATSNNYKAWVTYARDYGPIASQELEGYSAAKHWYKLDSIVVKSKLSNQRISKYQFNYYENDSSRLYLKELRCYGPGNIEFKNYRFNYNMAPLPRYAQWQIDAWGYYNGKDFFKSVPPDSGYFYSNNKLRYSYPLYRTPSLDPNINSAGYLTEIIYPTGGSDHLIYENNTYSSYVKSTADTSTRIISNDTITTLVPTFKVVNNNVNELAGGQRIKRIISTFADSLYPIVRDFYYVKNYQTGDTTSSGVLSAKPEFYEYGRSKEYNYFKFSALPLLIPNTTIGEDITYTKVYETLPDGGFIEYNFTNHDNGYIDRPATAYLTNNVTKSDYDNFALISKLKYNSLENERGLLLSSKIYDNSNRLLKKTINTYKTDSIATDDKIRGIDFESELFGTPTSENPPKYDPYGSIEVNRMSAYNIFTFQINQETKKTITYNLNQGDSIITMEYYKYNTGPFHQLKSVETSNSKSLSKRNVYRYSNDFLNSTIYQIMASNNMITQIIEDSLIVNNFPQYINKTNYEKIYPLGTTNPLNFIAPITTSQQIRNGLPILLDTIKAYTVNGNIAEIGRQDGTNEIYIWGYNFEYPVAKIVSKYLSYATVLDLMGNPWSKQNSPYLSENDMKVVLDNLRASLANTDASISTYTYIPGIGISSEKNIRKDIVQYKYDGMGRLKYKLDKDNNIQNNHTYNYTTKSIPLYYSSTKSGKFKVNLCSGQLIGDSIIYSIPNGKYVSTKSQVDADMRAQNDINANGQNYANSIGGCKVKVVVHNIGMQKDVPGIIQFVNT